jgi:hypothetical protein
MKIHMVDRAEPAEADRQGSRLQNGFRRQRFPPCFFCLMIFPKIAMPLAL